MSKSEHKYFLSLYTPIHENFEKFCRARAYGRMDPEDLMNDTLLIAYQKISQLKSKESFLSYLFSIAIRLLANNKKKKKEELFFANDTFHSIPDKNMQTDIDIDVYFLYQALTLLPTYQREAIILFEISGFNLKEVSQIQHASLSAVKQRLKRGREKLKRILTHSFENKLT